MEKDPTLVAESNRVKGCFAANQNGRSREHFKLFN